MLYLYKIVNVMGKIERFEDLKCWKAARELVKEVYTLSDAGRLSKDFDTRSQFRKAALSSMNNIAEGFGRFSKKDLFGFWILPRAQYWKCKVCYMYCQIWIIYQQII